MIFKRKYKRKSSNLKSKNSRFLPLFSILLVMVFYGFTNTYNTSWNFDWNGIRPEIKDSIIALNKYGSLTNNYVGYSGRTPQQWYRQKWLLQNLKNNELIKLTDFPSGSVKGIAYKGIMRNSKINQYYFYKKSLKDTLTFVYYQSGCLGNEFLLSEYVIDFLHQGKRSQLNLHLSKTEKKEILQLYNAHLKKKEFYKKEYFKTIK